MLHRNNEDILNTIYQNSRMAYDSTRQVIARCNNKGLSEYLERQKNHYAATCKQAREKLESSDMQVRPVPVMQQTMAHIGIAMKTAFNRSGSHIAELMYDGTNMGIINIARSVNHSSNADPETLKLAEDLMSGEEKYADGLRKFL